MRKRGFEDWCDRAVSRISYPPDRQEVRQELLWHLEDTAGLYEESGLSRPEAEARALEGMGDPREVGALLRRVHKPWLGTLLFITDLLLVLMVLYAFIALVMNGAGAGIGRELERLAGREELTGEELCGVFSYGRQEEYRLVCQPEYGGGPVRCGAYRFDLSGAWLWCRETDGQELLVLSLEFSSPRFWLGAPEGFPDYFCAEESTGRLHPPAWWPVHTDGVELMMDTGSTAVGSIYACVEVDGDAEWVDFLYSHGEGFALRLSIPRGGEGA